MIPIEQYWLVTEPIDMRAGMQTMLGKVVSVFGSAQANHDAGHRWPESSQHLHRCGAGNHLPETGDPIDKACHQKDPRDH